MSKLGEFERIARFFSPLVEGQSDALGLTDDAALVTPPAGTAMAVTADALVAGVHFLPDDPADLVARKALRVNISDLAAMGAEPYGYTITLALPRDIADVEAWIEQFARGQAIDHAEFAIRLLGGDSVSTDPCLLRYSVWLGCCRQALTRAGPIPAMISMCPAASGTCPWAWFLQGEAFDLTTAERTGAERLLPHPLRAWPELRDIASAGLEGTDGLLPSGLFTRFQVMVRQLSWL